MVENSDGNTCANEKLVTCVEIIVKQDFIGEFIDATIKKHEASISELGNIQFDVLQSIEDECLFLLYEAYESVCDRENHKKSPHYMLWRDHVSDWMEIPRQSAFYKVIAPK